MSLKQSGPIEHAAFKISGAMDRLMKAFDLVWTCFIFPFPKQKRTQKKRKGYLLFLSSVVETDNHTCSKLYISIRTATNTQTAY